MKIILLAGQSGSGKTSVGRELAKNEDKYNFVHSYTDRQMRETNEYGHTFVDSKEMDSLLKRDDIVASTQIKEKRYCTIKSQFDKDRINIYTVDVNGINDTIKAFPRADIMSILIMRDSIDIESERVERDVAIPRREDVDFLINNNTSIASVAATIDALVNADLFSKPSHVLSTIEDSLEAIYEQRRYLQQIEKSLEEQRWYRDQSLYNQLINYVNKQIKKDFDVTIEKDHEPQWDGENCVYTIVAWYKDDIMPAETFRINELLSKYVYDFCSENDCMDLMYRTYIDSDWVGLKDE
jgi:guanylate kinase